VPLVGVKLVTVGAGTVKMALVATAPLVTRMGPVVAVVGTVAVICVAELTTKPGAGMLLKLTAEAPVKLVPVMTTVVPAEPLVGVKLVMVGAGTVKMALVATAPLVTRMGPEVAPVGTLTVIWVGELTTKPGAATLLKLTAVVPVKLVPVMTTLVPARPLVGVKLVMVGAGTVKLVLLVAVAMFVTRIGPVVAPAGTLTVICVAELTTKPGAGMLLKLTAVVPVKPVPVMTTLVPGRPLVGVKLVMVGTLVRHEMAASKPARTTEPSEWNTRVSWPVALLA
jgi:acyl-CoA-binding protein